MRHLHAIVFSIGLTVSLWSNATAQTRHSSRVIYQYPLDGAKGVAIGSEIGIRIEGRFGAVTAASIEVKGSRSGLHETEARLSSDKRMAIFTPLSPFMLNDTIRIRFRAMAMDGSLVTDTFSFVTVNLQLQVSRESLESGLAIPAKRSSPHTMSSGDSDDLPAMHVLSDAQPEQGRILMANLGFAPIPNESFLFILDEHGRIVTRRLLQGSHALDFKIQPTGLLTYYDAAAMKFYGLDTNLVIVDSFEALHGYPTDGHELRLFPGGGYMLLGTSQTAMNMSSLVEGGFYQASVTGSVIEVFDSERNVVLEWRGIDHFNILDAVHEDLTAPFIDFEHVNALDTDLDGNIILSNRHLSEVTKINRETGEIMWRLGGAHNQFTFVNDTLAFSYQHATRILPNGHLVLFDNGNFHPVQRSRALEYALDTSAMTATLVWQYHHTPEIYSPAMGYVERYADSSTLISWGANDTTMTEIRPDGSTAFEMSMDSGNFTYRAFKYPIASALTRASVSESPSPGALELREADHGQSLEAAFSLDEPSEVTFGLYDVTGRELIKKDEGAIGSRARQQVSIVTSGVPSGVYYGVLRTNMGTLVRPVPITH